ncbi:hypothetical protein ON010_g17817 [Phytophthora cinnamomi]|nr:hypothetical protein ON010_g17817 [Phytophthora cinnamomi]
MCFLGYQRVEQQPTLKACPRSEPWNYRKSTNIRVPDSPRARRRPTQNNAQSSLLYFRPFNKSVNQIVFEFIKAPHLGDWSHDVLVKRKQARDVYEETVRQRCIENRERPEVAMKPVKSSIDRNLLEVMCLYELRRTVENVNIDEVFKKKLRINLAEDGVDVGVLKYYRDFATIIENNSLGKILGVRDPEAEGFADRMKLQCTILNDNLEPRMVRDDVKRIETQCE